MSPQLWQQVSELYHAVLEAEPSRRKELLESADPVLRSEVEGLLSGSSSDSSPFERDVLSHAGALLSGEPEQGRCIGLPVHRRLSFLPASA